VILYEAFIYVGTNQFFLDNPEILSPNEQLPHLTRMNASKVRLMKASLFEMEVADDGMLLFFSHLFLNGLQSTFFYNGICANFLVI
jgi:hypothetical protein